MVVFGQSLSMYYTCSSHIWPLYNVYTIWLPHLKRVQSPSDSFFIVTPVAGFWIYLRSSECAIAVFEYSCLLLNALLLEEPMLSNRCQQTPDASLYWRNTPTSFKFTHSCLIYYITSSLVHLLQKQQSQKSALSCMSNASHVTFHTTCCS